LPALALAFLLDPGALSRDGDGDGEYLGPLRYLRAWTHRAAAHAVADLAEACQPGVTGTHPQLLAVVLLAGAGFAWLVGEVAAVNALSQFALIFILILHRAGGARLAGRALHCLSAVFPAFRRALW
jgi:hypothetical protein